MFAFPTSETFCKITRNICKQYRIPEFSDYRILHTIGFCYRSEELQPDIAKCLTRYPLVPATLLGRLAVDTRFQGQGYGEFLLLDALHRTLIHAADVATIGVVVDASNERALTVWPKQHVFRVQKIGIFWYTVNQIASWISKI